MRTFSGPDSGLILTSSVERHTELARSLDLRRAPKQPLAYPRLLHKVSNGSVKTRGCLRYTVGADSMEMQGAHVVQEWPEQSGNDHRSGEQGFCLLCFNRMSKASAPLRCTYRLVHVASNSRIVSSDGLMLAQPLIMLKSHLLLFGTLGTLQYVKDQIIRRYTVERISVHAPQLRVLSSSRP
jgi:hypothetical protein